MTIITFEQTPGHGAIGPVPGEPARTHRLHWKAHLYALRREVEHAAEPQLSLCDPLLSFWGPLVKKEGDSWC